jgi:hypothetical protein
LQNRIRTYKDSAILPVSDFATAVFAKPGCVFATIASQRSLGPSDGPRELVIDGRLFHHDKHSRLSQALTLMHEYFWASGIQGASTIRELVAILTQNRPLKYSEVATIYSLFSERTETLLFNNENYFSTLNSKENYFTKLKDTDLNPQSGAYSPALEYGLVVRSALTKSVIKAFAAIVDAQMRFQPPKPFRSDLFTLEIICGSRSNRYFGMSSKIRETSCLDAYIDNTQAVAAYGGYKHYNRRISGKQATLLKQANEQLKTAAKKAWDTAFELEMQKHSIEIQNAETKYLKSNKMGFTQEAQEIFETNVKELKQGYGIPSLKKLFEISTPTLPVELAFPEFPIKGVNIPGVPELEE